MGVQISANVWKYSPHKGSVLLVLLAIADHAGNDSGECYPSQARLVQYCRMNRRSVQRALKVLVKDGSIQIIRLGGMYGGCKKSSIYRVRSPYYTGRKEAKYQEYLFSKHWQKLRLTAFDKANHACESCGATSSLHGHHMIYRNPITACTAEDIMCLCDTCHDKLHTIYRAKLGSIPRTREETKLILKESL